MNQAISRLYSRWWFFAIEHSVLLLIPTLLAFRDIGFINYRHTLMAFGLVYVFWVIRTLNISLPELGIAKKGFYLSLLQTVPLTVIVAMTLLFGLALKPQTLTSACQTRLPLTQGWPWWLIIGSYVFYSVPIQEFLFRGYMISRLRRITSNETVIIMVSAMFFFVVHLPFVNKLFALSTLPLGLLLGYVFVKKQHLAGPLFAHSLLGGVFIYQTISLCGW